MLWGSIPQEGCVFCNHLFTIPSHHKLPLDSSCTHIFKAWWQGNWYTSSFWYPSCPLKELLAQGVCISQCRRIQFFYKQKPVISWLVMLVNHYMLFNHIKEIAYLSMQITSFPVVWYPISFQYAIWTISNANHEVIASISQNGWSWGSYLGVHSQ